MNKINHLFAKKPLLRPKIQQFCHLDSDIAMQKFQGQAGK